MAGKRRQFLKAANKRTKQEETRRKPTNKSVLEKSTELTVCKKLVAAGFKHKKDGLDGWPDRQVFPGAGMHFWIEFKHKRVNKKLRAMQVVITKHLRKQGDHVYIIDSADDINAVIEHWRKRGLAVLEALAMFAQQEQVARETPPAPVAPATADISDML